MKFLLFVTLICVCLQYVSLQQQHEQNFEEQIKQLQSEVKKQRQYLKEVYHKLIPETEQPKQEYLRRKGKNRTMGKPLKEYEKLFDDQIHAAVKNISSHAVADFKQTIPLHTDDGVLCCLALTFRQFKDWNAGENLLNVAYLEQTQKDRLAKNGELKYELMREDYSEALELCEMDFSKTLPTETVARIMSLPQMLYGDRTKIESGLSYLYGYPVTANQTDDIITLLMQLVVG